MSSTEFDNLSAYIVKKGFRMIKKYSTGKDMFILVIDENTGEKLLISVPSKYSISCSDTIELVAFTDTETVTVTRSTSNVYNEIPASGLEDDKYLDPTEADRLMEQYQAIDIETEKTDVLKDNIIVYKTQLERLRFCTNNIKYKLSLITDSSVCCITRSNTVDCFVVKKSNPSPDEDKELYIMVDIETFFDASDNIHTDVVMVTRNLHTILEKAHDKQTTVVVSRIKQIQAITNPLIEKQIKKAQYQKSIKKLTDVVLNIRRQEKELMSRIKKVNDDNRSISILSTENKSFKLKNLENEYDKLQKFKHESVELLIGLKTEYNNFVLNIDCALFDTIKNCNQIVSSMKKAGILKCKNAN